MKKLLILMLSLVMILAFTVVSFASDVRKETVTTEDQLTAAIADGCDVVLGADISLTKTLYVPKNVKATLDLNGKTITALDSNTTGNFEAIHSNGHLTVKDSVGGGKIALSALYDRGYQSASVVILNDVGGTLVIDSGVIEHNGGSTMAYAIDSRTNGKGTSAIVYVNGGTISSTYIAIRQYLNGTEATNELTINAGEIVGGNSSLYFQSPSAYANTGVLVIKKDASLSNRVYLGVTAGATEWPVEVSIDCAAFEGSNANIVTKNVPESYGLLTTNGVVEVKSYVAEFNGVKYFTLQEALDVLADGGELKLLSDVTVNKTIAINNEITIDLNGKKVTSTAQKAFEIYKNATIQNGTIEAAQRCVDTRKAVNLTLTKVTLIATKYTYGNPQPLTIGGSQNGTVATLTDVSISTKNGYGIIAFVKTELTATNTTIAGYNSLYTKAGSEGSTFTFINSILEIDNTANDVSGNSFAAIVMGTDSIKVVLDENSTLTAKGKHAYAIALGTMVDKKVVSNIEITVKGTISGNLINSKTMVSNTVVVPSEYVEAAYARGYNAKLSADGKSCTLVNWELADIFTYLGASTRIGGGGITVGFEFNKNAYEAYIVRTEKELDFGMHFAVAGNKAMESSFADLADDAGQFNVIVDGINESHAALVLEMALYVVENDTKHYVTANGLESTITATYLVADFYGKEEEIA